MKVCSYANLILSSDSRRTFSTTGSRCPFSEEPPRSSSQFADQVILVSSLVIRALGRAGEDPEEFLDPAASLEHQLAALVQLPAAAPPVLVLVAERIPLPGAGFDVVEPDVFGARAVGPCLFAGHRTGVAADAFVQVHDHAHLSHNTHQYCTSWDRRRTVATMSRWFPVGPR